MAPLEEYFERIRKAYGIELVGTIELRDTRDETDDEEDRGEQSQSGENRHDA